ncbi:methyl-accepting chemotaxis protein [Vibrio sp. T187]|uniref:methyl-accepting chemotaxis protein n=1 Tax=Vibrio TaxID=662 RepID=UPI0010C93898|nr:MULTISPECIES: methyl-accepting chemotaxis protein [Vibrio]MBW3698132.1 methyl-accepting chemotaxis protein [Vibrio sp. T187]
MKFVNTILNRIKVGAKIRLIIILSSLFIIGLEFVSAYQLKEEILTERKNAAMSLVETIVAQAEFVSASTNASPQEKQTLIKELVKSVRYASNGYFFINHLDGTMIMHPIKPQLDDQNMLANSKSYVRNAFSDFIAVAKQQGEGFVTYDWPIPGSNELEKKISFVKKTDSLPWVVGTGVYYSDVEEAFKEQLMTSLLNSGLILLILITISSLISRNIVRPLQKITKTMSQIAEEKDLTIEMKSQGKDELSVMASAFNKMNQNIKGVVTNINMNTSSLASQAEELSTVTTQIQGGVVEQKAQTEAVSISVQHLEQASNTVTDKALVALEEIEVATQAAKSGNQSIDANIEIIEVVASKVNGAVVNAEKLEDSSNKIGDIIEVIKQIAEQTNLLALNAAIEAARAGDQGRGFAVVADEVRTLASRTQESTGSIQDIITELQADVSTTVQVMRDCETYTAEGIEKAIVCGRELENIQSSINSLSEMAKDISYSAKEQTQQVVEISANVDNIAAVAEQTEIGTAQTSQSSEHLSGMAQELNGLVNSFKV